LEPWTVWDEGDDEYYTALRVVGVDIDSFCEHAVCVLYDTSNLLVMQAAGQEGSQTEWDEGSGSGEYIASEHPGGVRGHVCELVQFSRRDYIRTECGLVLFSNEGLVVCVAIRTFFRPFFEGRLSRSGGPTFSASAGVIIVIRATGGVHHYCQH
jgi:hypothetical protein